MQTGNEKPEAKKGQQAKVAAQQLCDQASKEFGCVTVHYREHNSSYTTGYGSDRHVHHTCHSWLEIQYPMTATTTAATATATAIPTAPLEAEIPMVMAQVPSQAAYSSKV